MEEGRDGGREGGDAATARFKLHEFSGPDFTLVIFCTLFHLLFFLFFLLQKLMEPARLVPTAYKSSDEVTVSLPADIRDEQCRRGAPNYFRGRTCYDRTLRYTAFWRKKNYD